MLYSSRNCDNDIPGWNWIRLTAMTSGLIHAYELSLGKLIAELGAYSSHLKRYFQHRQLRRSPILLYTMSFASAAESFVDISMGSPAQLRTNCNQDQQE
jgi:hypothetical protein